MRVKLLKPLNIKGKTIALSDRIYEAKELGLDEKTIKTLIDKKALVKVEGRREKAEGEKR